MSTEDICSFGFVCELRDDIAKIYTIENGIVEIQNTEELELGTWCEFASNEIERCMNFKNEKCEVWVEDEEVFVKVLAIGPNDFALPKDIRIKYKYAVWSPFLKFLDDEENLFKDNIRGGDVVELDVLKPSSGSKEFCSYLFCPAVGLVRWVITELENTPTPSSSKPAQYNVEDDMCKADKRLGSWVSFKLTEAKKFGKAKDSMGVKALLRTTATQAKEVQNPPRETKVVNGEIEIETSFLFNKNMLEFEGSRLIGDWRVRHQQLKKDAHFWDVYLGRVEVYLDTSRLIIETIEAHRNNLDPEEAKKLENEAIVVSITAIVDINHLQNFEKYPDRGFFTAKVVDTICYLNGGKIIYKK
ncbi:hypothetical protein GCK72_022591 [Caenorhabditis remanei]|uniref:Uncharacterized protein n=1 Tax=Caenorhabditis remanei TaxID=31234 RepID=A0A6A5FU45_CAERE|nr:hypothetical protein GCK72_022591 [Caenorhabditis remanei]KAF1746138.1 hypothetical protein GCK72_022591 [Caenorhabditis remanei]